MIGSRYEKNRILTFDERVDPASTALVVIDVQNDFALPQGVCGQVGDDVSPVAPMVARLKGLIELARRAGVLILFVRTLYDEPVLSPALAEQYLRRRYPNSICRSGTAGAEFHDGIGPRDALNEILVTKHRYSAFWGSSIDLVLRTNRIRTVVLTGIATEVCVKLTARDAFFRDYQVVVPEDCVGSYSQERQQASLTVIARSFGVVSSSPEIAAVWKRLENDPRHWQRQKRVEHALTTPEARLRPLHTALVLMDLQSGFYAPNAAGGANSALLQTLPAARRLLDDARRAGCFIIHCCPAANCGPDRDNASFVVEFRAARRGARRRLSPFQRARGFAARAIAAKQLHTHYGFRRRHDQRPGRKHGARGSRPGLPCGRRGGLRRGV